MSAAVIDGKAIAAELQAEMSREAGYLHARGVVPRLDVVLVGNDPASHTYVRGKVRDAERIGILARDHLLPETTHQDELLELVRSLSADPEVHGVLVQLPLPPGLNSAPVLEAVAPEKDVDGLHPTSMGRLLKGPTPMPPCTPAGIMEILRRSGVDLRGKETVVVGRSDLVGKPVALLLMHQNATVTICHSRTRDLARECRRAEVLVVAIGRPRMVTAEFVRPAAVVIDVGINREGDRLVGDVDFETARFVASAITPVPGGVGPLTRAMLMRNTLTAAKSQSGVK